MQIAEQLLSFKFFRMKFFSIPILILLSVTIVSCQKQLDPEPDAARVTIGITLPKDAIAPFGEERATKAGPIYPIAPGTGNHTEESVIRRVTIYVFRAENRNYLPLDAYADYYDATNKGFGTADNIDLSQFTVATTPGIRDIYVVLNLPGGFGESVVGTESVYPIRSFADLQTIKIPLSSQYGYSHSSSGSPEIPQYEFERDGFEKRSNPSYRGLTMCGHYIGLNVSEDASIEIATISRLVSSINFGMWNNDPPTSQFFTDKMFLMNVSGESYIVPKRSATELAADNSINTKNYLNTNNYVTDYYTEEPYNCGSYRVRTIEWLGQIEDEGDKVYLEQENPTQTGKPNLYSAGGKYDHTCGTLSGTDYGSYDIAAATNAVPPDMFFGGTQVIVQQDSYRDNGYPTENKPIKLNSTDGEPFAAWSKIFYVFPNLNNQIEGKSYPTCAVVSTVKSNSAGSGEAIPWNPANLRYYTAVVNKDGTNPYIHRNKKYWINIQINNTEGEEKGSANPWSGLNGGNAQQ